MKKFGWYRRRSYPHFDLPLPADAAQKLVEDTDAVASHSFFPFLAFDIRSRKHKRIAKKRIVVAKDRPIRMSAHVDGYIFAYYAYSLGSAYEMKISGTPLEASAIAYRRSLGSNVDFAKAAFEEIERRKNCVAIAMDIEQFFESIDHINLKKQWQAVLGVARLPADHFAVYRAVTRYSVVDRDTCLTRLGIDEKHIPHPICNARSFRNLIRGDDGVHSRLVTTHTEPYGIPQGSQISALLSNIYMMPFDLGMSRMAARIGAYYRRYSDDILVICNPEDEVLVKNEAQRLLTAVGNRLKINPAKTMVSRFQRTPHGTCECVNVPIQYLGFTFDGERKLLRSGTVSKYWRGMVYAVRGVKYQARKAYRAGGKAAPFKRSLYRQYSHLGKRRNFIRYAYNAADKMGARSIKKQLSGHWSRLQDLLEK